jgi:hypothetical protein
MTRSAEVASRRVRLAALFLILGLAAGPVSTQVYWLLGGTWGLSTAVLVVLARVGLWHQPFVSDRIVRLFAWAVAAIFLAETLAALTWSRGEPRWLLYAPFSLVLAVLASIVAGSDGAPSH